MEIQQGVALAPLTTIKLGGTASVFIECVNETDIQEALQFAHEKNLLIHVLGGGSNTIFHDDGFAGLVLAVRLKGVTFQEKESYVEADVAAGEDWDSFVQQCIGRGFGGLECMSGVPGLVGATPIQNVGAYGQEVSEVITHVRAVDRTSGKVQTFSAKECAFGYRTSRFKTTDANTYIITSVRFRLSPNATPNIHYEQLREALSSTEPLGTGKPALQKVREAVLGLRKSKSMLVSVDDPHSQSCGSFFVAPLISLDVLARITDIVGEEPPHFTAASESKDAHSLQGMVKIPAGWLIEQAGFERGYRRNGIGISPNHALALVNYSGTSQDLLSFAQEIQQVVRDKFGVVLEQEPVAVPAELA